MSRKKTGPEVKDSNSNGRDANGRFTEGNQLARGNPFNRRMAEMRQAMLDAVSAEDLQDIVRQVVVKARLGDLTAAKLVLSYVVGKPGTAVEPDRVDLDEWQLHTERPALSQVQRAMAGSIRPDLANLSVQATDLNVGDAVCQGIRALKPETPPSDGGLTGAGEPANPAANKGNKGNKPAAKAQRPVESSDVSILGSRSNGKSKTPLSDSGYTGHFIDRIMAEGTGLNGDGRRE